MAGLVPFVVSEENFKLFHAMDRELYTLLVFNLQRDPMESMQIMAFWLWLERAGYRNTVHKIRLLPQVLINELADEAITCLTCIKSEYLASSLRYCNNLLLTQGLMQKEISLQLIHENRLIATEGMSKILDDVCNRAFADIKQQGTNINTSATFASGVIGERKIDNPGTVIATFFKGSPVSAWELTGFFTRSFGDCVLAVQMQQVNPGEQPLFARVTFTAGNVPAIFSAVDKVQFFINGKPVCFRRSIRG